MSPLLWGIPWGILWGGAALAPGAACQGPAPGLDARDVLHGPRVFALAPPSGPGLVGTFAFGDGLEILPDPLRLELVRIDARGRWAEKVALEPIDEVVHPTHLVRTWRGAGLVLEERLWVGQDDACVAEWLIANPGPQECEFELVASSGVADRPDRSRSRPQPIALPQEDWVDSAPLGLSLPPPGGLELDGIPFALAPGPGGLRSAVLAPPAGGTGLGEVRLEFPSQRPAALVVHALLAIGTPLGEGGGSPGWVRAILEDGGAEVLPLPAPGELWAHPVPGRGATLRTVFSPELRGRVEWRAWGVGAPGRFLLHLAYRPPPGRFVEGLALARAGGPEHPALCALILEVLPVEGPLPVLVGSASLGGAPVPWALAATGALPQATDAGARVLVRRIPLEAGGSARAVVALVPGVRGFQAALLAMGLAEDEPGAGALLAGHVAAREAFDAAHLPRWTCADAALQDSWRRALALLLRDRRSLGLPDFSLPVLYEGTCCADHARVSPLDATLALADLRWWARDDTAQGTLRALLKLQSPDGRIVPVAPGRSFGAEPHALAAAVLEVHAVVGSAQFLREALPLLERDLDARLARGSARGPGPGTAEHTLLEASARALVQGFSLLGEHPRAQAIAERAAHLEPLAALPDYRSAARALLAARTHPACAAPQPRGRLDQVLTGWVGLEPLLDGDLAIDPPAPHPPAYRLGGLLHRGRGLELGWEPAAPEDPDPLPRFWVELDGLRIHEGPGPVPLRIP